MAATIRALRHNLLEVHLIARLHKLHPSLAMSVILEMYHAIQACVSALAALLSVMAIYSLNQWEPQAETASRYSTTASKQLHKTRTTQASGALAVSCTVSPSTYQLLIEVDRILSDLFCRMRRDCLIWWKCHTVAAQCRQRWGYLPCVQPHREFLARQRQGAFHADLQ